MNFALRKPTSLAEFLSWEERQELRYEFDGFQPIAMTGGTAAHAAIQRNILFALTGRLRGKLCQPYGSDLKIEVAGRIRYPDAFVVCTPVANTARIVTDPVIVFEVLSASTTETDLVTKNAEYRATPSIQRYVILSQTEAAAMIFVRRGEEWMSEVVMEGGHLPLPEIDADIPLAELYADIDLSAPPEAETEDA